MHWRSMALPSDGTVMTCDGMALTSYGQVQRRHSTGMQGQRAVVLRRRLASSGDGAQRPGARVSADHRAPVGPPGRQEGPT